MRHAVVLEHHADHPGVVHVEVLDDIQLGVRAMNARDGNAREHPRQEQLVLEVLLVMADVDSERSDERELVIRETAES